MRRTFSVAVIGALVAVAAACGSSTTATTPVDNTAVGFATTPGTDSGTTAATGGDTGTTVRQGTTTSSSGGTSSTSSSSTSTATGGGGGSVSQADFDRQVGALCATFQSEGDKIFDGSGTPTQADFDKAVAFLKDFLDKVKAVGVPPGKEQAAQTFYDKWNTFVDVFDKYGPQIISGKEPPSSAVTDLETATNDVESSAKALGNFDTCFASSNSSSGSGN